MPAGITESNIIAITGHRNYPDRAALFRGLDNLRAREYIFGGARGADTDALDYLARTQPRSRRTVIVPNRVADQPAVAQRSIRNSASHVIELRNTGANRFQLRNRAMVDRSSHVRAFYDFRGRGGTFNTIQYAKSKGKSYDIWPMYEYDERKVLGMNREEAVDWIKQMRRYKVKLIAIKRLVLQLLDEVVRSSVQAFLSECQAVGYNNLEAWWYSSLE